MVEHPGADDQIEAPFQRADFSIGNRRVSRFVRLYFRFSCLGVIEAGRADVDADDSGIGPA